MAGFDLSGKVALVTGAGSGLGRAFAQGLAGAGARVVCADRNRAWAEETASLIQPGGNAAVALEADVADAASVADMAARAQAACGRVDILINNAGIATVPHRVHRCRSKTGTGSSRSICAACSSRRARCCR